MNITLWLIDGMYLFYFLSINFDDSAGHSTLMGFGCWTAKNFKYSLCFINVNGLWPILQFYNKSKLQRIIMVGIRNELK